MSVRINNIILKIDEDIECLKKKAAKKLRINEKNISEFKILRESVDARNKTDIKFNYTLEINCENERELVRRLRSNDIILEEKRWNGNIIHGNRKMEGRPVIVGMGPAGLFSALILAENGYRPVIIERGEAIEERDKKVKLFWKNKTLDLNSNVQFGEGGAGTYSDGKLTTRIKDNRCDYVLSRFHKFGAPEEIIYSGKPHIGTDILKNVVVNMRKEIIRLGGEVRFNSKLNDITIKNGRIYSVKVNDETIMCENLILAIGHSSRDTYKMLFKKGIEMEFKPFAVGFRIEHPQRMIDESQYGSFAGHKRLKAADYRLTYTSKTYNKGVYSFCMCPGGVVVNASSEEMAVAVNGMSYYKRDGVNANSAIVSTISSEDIDVLSPLSGMEFQKFMENKAFNAGGGKYMAPVQLLGDFMESRTSLKIGEINPSVTSGYNLADLSVCFPVNVKKSLQEGLIDFGRKIKGFDRYDAVLTGVETRTSAPIRIIRNENLEAMLISGLYPCGEGAGYAGGIVSAAVDGIKCSEKIIAKYKPFI